MVSRNLPPANPQTNPATFRNLARHGAGAGSAPRHAEVAALRVRNRARLRADMDRWNSHRTRKAGFGHEVAR